VCGSNGPPPPIGRNSKQLQLEIKTEGVEFVVSRAPQPKNDNDGRQKADRDTGAPLHVAELVAMDETGAEVIKVTTAGGTLSG
jgi:hypothetical protein